MRTTDIILAIIIGYWSISLFSNNHYVTFYQLKAAVVGVKQLFSLPQDDIDKCETPKPHAHHVHSPQTPLSQVMHLSYITICVLCIII